MIEKYTLHVALLLGHFTISFSATNTLSEANSFVLPWCNNTDELGMQIGIEEAIAKVRSTPLYYDIYNLGAEERACWTTPFPGDRDNIKFAKVQIKRCMDDLAPEEPDWFTSFGLVRDYDFPRIACADGSACMALNEMLLDGTLEEVGVGCGGLDLFYEMARRPQSKATMQMTIDCWNNKPEGGCWGELETGEEIACPVYGPTYKGNLLIAYFFGGLKRVSQMPRCRMPLSLLQDVMKGTWDGNNNQD